MHVTTDADCTFGRCTPEGERLLYSRLISWSSCTECNCLMRWIKQGFKPSPTKLHTNVYTFRLSTAQYNTPFPPAFICISGNVGGRVIPGKGGGSQSQFAPSIDTVPLQFSTSHYNRQCSLWQTNIIAYQWRVNEIYNFPMFPVPVWNTTQWVSGVQFPKNWNGKLALQSYGYVHYVFEGVTMFLKLYTAR